MTNLNSVFAASVSMLNADLSLDIEGTIEHAFKVEKQGVSPAFLGSTSMAQLLEISDKKKLIREIVKHKYQSVLIGTGCNSLGDTKNLIRYSLDQGFKGAFLIMNPSYYSPDDTGVYDFFSGIIKAIPCKYKKKGDKAAKKRGEPKCEDLPHCKWNPPGENPGCVDKET